MYCYLLTSPKTLLTSIRILTHLLIPIASLFSLAKHKPRNCHFVLIYNIYSLSCDKLTPFEAANLPFEAANFPFKAANSPFEAANFPFVAANSPFEVANFPFEAANLPFVAANFPFVAANFPFVATNLPFALFRLFEVPSE